MYAQTANQVITVQDSQGIRSFSSFSPVRWDNSHVNAEAVENVLSSPPAPPLKDSGTEEKRA